MCYMLLVCVCVCVCACVCVCVCIVLGIQHAMRMRHIAICSLPRSITFLHSISFLFYFTNGRYIECLSLTCATDKRKKEGKNKKQKEKETLTVNIKS